MREDTTSDWKQTNAAAGGVSMVVPALNAAGTIARTIAALREEIHPIATELELIVVDDGSSDGTDEVVQKLRADATDVRLLRNHTNLGKGLAVYVGVLASRHATVCFTDADLAFAKGDYARVVQRVLDGSKFAVASRRLRDSVIQARIGVLSYAVRRHVLGIGFNRLVHLALSLPFGDTQCGLKAFDRATAIDLFRRLHTPRFLFDIELFLAARHMGIAIDEVAVCIVYDDLKSSVRLAAHSPAFLSTLAGIWRHEHGGDYRRDNEQMIPDSVWRKTTEVDLP